MYLLHDCSFFLKATSPLHNMAVRDPFANQHAFYDANHAQIRDVLLRRRLVLPPSVIVTLLIRPRLAGTVPKTTSSTHATVTT